MEENPNGDVAKVSMNKCLSVLQKEDKNKKKNHVKSMKHFVNIIWKRKRKRKKTKKMIIIMIIMKYMNPNIIIKHLNSKIIMMHN